MIETITWLLLSQFQGNKPHRNSPEPSEPCLRNLHQHAPALSGTFRNCEYLVTQLTTKQPLYSCAVKYLFLSVRQLIRLVTLWLKSKSASGTVCFQMVAEPKDPNFGWGLFASWKLLQPSNGEAGWCVACTMPTGHDDGDQQQWWFYGTWGYGTWGWWWEDDPLCQIRYLVSRWCLQRLQ